MSSEDERSDFRLFFDQDVVVVCFETVMVEAESRTHVVLLFVIQALLIRCHIRFHTRLRHWQLHSCDASFTFTSRLG